MVKKSLPCKFGDLSSDSENPTWFHTALFGAEPRGSLERRVSIAVIKHYEQKGNLEGKELVPRSPHPGKSGQELNTGTCGKYFENLQLWVSQSMQ